MIPKEPVQGQCFCGGVRFELRFPTEFCSHCHCEDCRRAHGSAFVTWTAVPLDQFRFLAGQEKLNKKFESHPGIRWGFCGECGTSLLYDCDKAPEKIYLTVANLLGPLDREPDAHVSFEEHVPWLEIQDRLPKYREKSKVRWDDSNPLRRSGTESHNLGALASQVVAGHKNFLVGEVNDHCLRLAVNEDRTYDWHSHPNSDELFIVLSGSLSIEFQDRDFVALRPGDFYTVAKGLVHRTIATGRTVNLCIESTKASTVFLSDPSGIMGDEEFLQAFEACTLPKEFWKHRTHVRMAWLYLKRLSFDQALDRVREGIQRYNLKNGKPGGYRETETQFFVRFIAHKMRQTADTASFNEFCEQHRDLFDGNKPPRKAYYSDPLWKSPETWTSFVQPDLSPLPEVR